MPSISAVLIQSAPTALMQAAPTGLMQSAPAGESLTAGRFISAALITLVACIPIGISLWAFLDAARRPQWAWALSDRRQVVWLVAIPFGVLTVIGGLLISLWYLFKVRPMVAAAERGEFKNT